jgi:hypothetical protein
MISPSDIQILHWTTEDEIAGYQTTTLSRKRAPVTKGRGTTSWKNGDISCTPMKAYSEGTLEWNIK